MIDTKRELVKIASQINRMNNDIRELERTLMNLIEKNIRFVDDKGDVDWSTVEVDGINGWDYPDFVDAYFSYAEWENGQPLTDDELEWLDETFADKLHEIASEQ